MFESEIEMEKRQSSFGPLILAAVLVITIVGGIGVFIYQQKRGLPQEDAKAVVLSIMADRGPAKTSFSTGKSVDENIAEPNYRLLEKAGIVKLGKRAARTPITLTADGEKLISSIPEYSKKTDSDGTTVHVVPLAQRKFLSIDQVTMLTHTTARVDYTWKWEPTTLGNYFDASGKLVKSFTTWDRSVLIDKYGAAFYTAEPTKTSIVLMKGDEGWKIMR